MRCERFVDLVDYHRPRVINVRLKELMVVFRHLMGQNYRRALFGQLDKLFDEQVLLGNGIASKETLRLVVLGRSLASLLIIYSGRSSTLQWLISSTTSRMK